MSIYNIPFSCSLLDILSQRLLKLYQADPQDLANCLIFLPNKRLIQNLRDKFLQNSNSSALILPKMVSISDLDYIISSIDIVALIDKKPIFADIFKSVISKNKRAFILAKIIQQKDSTINLTQAIYMATSLGQLIDEAYLENVDFSNIENIVVDSLAEHWQNILQFLYIATNFWPQFLAENNTIDVNYRKKLIYQLQQEIWTISPPTYHIIAVNIISVYPDVISLLNTIKNLKNGDLYFYGIDFNLNDENYNTLAFIHPQKLIANTLNTLNIPRDSIKLLPSDNCGIDNIIHQLFYKSLCKTLPQQDIDSFNQQITIIENKNEEEEARVIALLLRQNLETKGKTAGLISNNQNLIQRVLNELKKWNIISNDYLGTSLHHSIHAKFFMLVAKVLSDNFAPSTLLSLLNHPFAYFNQNRSLITKQTSLLNLHIARDLIYGSGLKAYYKTISTLSSQNLQTILNGFIKHIQKHFQPFLQLSSHFNYKFSFEELLKIHISIAENIAKEKIESTSALWTEQAGKELSLFLSSLLADCPSLSKVNFSEYLDILNIFILDVNIHSIYNKHPRIHIYGQMQSNLIHHDLLILSNMNEGSMPILLPANPWGNQEIMKKLGFVDKNYLIGMKSNIFCQYLGNKEIVFTRSNKADGRETNPSRWLLKITNMLSFYNHSSKINAETEKPYIYRLQESLYAPTTFKPLKNTIPSYAPPLFALPKKISATNIDKLIKNPYIFFIDNILKIKPLKPVAVSLEDREYGIKIHHILELFFQDITKYQSLSLSQQQEKLIALANQEFASWQQDILFQMFKWPLVKHALTSLLNHQAELIKNIQASFIEVNGAIKLTINNSDILLTGRSDRIDILHNKAYIYDYKTSTNTTIEDYQKQLLSLSLILIKQGFTQIDNAKLIEINNSFIFLPKKFDKQIILKDNGIANIVEYMPTFEQELNELLNLYYGKNPIAFRFNPDDSENKISADYKHFMRFNELNITLQHN